MATSESASFQKRRSRSRQQHSRATENDGNDTNCRGPEAHAAYRTPSHAKILAEETSSEKRNSAVAANIRYADQDAQPHWGSRNSARKTPLMLKCERHLISSHIPITLGNSALNNFID